jgi:hypothetical protein
MHIIGRDGKIFSVPPNLFIPAVLLVCMKKPVKLSIPEPCHENWDAMTPADKGRFCASCQKNVVDFTKSSDREVLAYLKQNHNVCGQFDNSQLDRELIIAAEKKRLWPVVAAIASLITLAPITAVSQTTESTEQTPRMKMGKVMQPPIVTITGMVSDAEGPLAGARVTIQNTAISVETDSDGNYTVEVLAGQTLVFTYRELEIQKNVVLRNSKVINATFKIEEVLDEVVIEAYKSTTRGTVAYTSIIQTPIKPISITKTAIEKKPTFFGRIFHSIGNLFR